MAQMDQSSSEMAQSSRMGWRKVMIRKLSSTLSHYVLRARSYVVIINTLFYKGILR